VHRLGAATLVVSAFVAVRPASPVHTQTPPAPARAQDAPAFEVASIRPNTSGDPRSGTHDLPGGRVTITNLPLRSMIRMAYGANDLEVVGGPDWVDGDRWDVLASAAPGSPADAPWRAMLKSLLVERFKLRAHLESRARPIYRLVFAGGDKRLGPDIRTTACRGDDLDCSKMAAATNGIKSGTISGVARTPAEIGTGLSRYAERRVFDATGLDGRYDFELRWAEDLSLFTALQEQLGLKLEPASGPVDVLFIDGVEKPTPD
jgi:uncharacterized protein (TIGR03435 family)